MLRTRIVAAVAVALVLALLAPSLALLVPHCGMEAGEACDNGAPGRCAGLWSSDCCDFVAPSPREHSSSSRLQSAFPLPAWLSSVTVRVAAAGALAVVTDAMRPDGSGSLQASLVESTVLLI